MSKTHESTCAVALNARQEGSCESKTPRTSKLLIEINEGRIYETVSPLVDHARQLETELNAAVHLVHFLSQYVESHDGRKGELAGCSITATEYDGMITCLKKIRED